MVNFEQLANSNRWSDRIRVACNPNTPLHILEKLSNDRDSWVRDSVLLNSNCPPVLNQAIKSFNELYYEEY